MGSCIESIEMVKLLVKKGSNIDSIDNSGKKFINYLNDDQKEEIEGIIYDIQRKKEMVKCCRRQ